MSSSWWCQVGRMKTTTTLWARSRRVSAGHHPEQVRAPHSPRPVNQIISSLQFSLLSCPCTAGELLHSKKPLLWELSLAALPPRWEGNSPGKEHTRARLQEAASKSCRSTWHCRDTGLAEQICWVDSGCYKQLTKIHKLWKSFTRPVPNLTWKGRALQGLCWLWSALTTGANFFLKVFMDRTALHDIYLTACFQDKNTPNKLQITSHAAILSHNTWVASVPLLVSEGQQRATSHYVATHHQFPTKSSAINTKLLQGYFHKKLILCSQPWQFPISFFGEVVEEVVARVLLAWDQMYRPWGHVHTHNPVAVPRL